ncbi:DUF185-domain-containing protein [Boletus coccyginus]|nr:DUF185-domain-containing protein [Boletus coccyginus]
MLATALRQAQRCCQRRQCLKAYFATSSIRWSDRPPPRKVDKEKFNFNPDVVFSVDVSQGYLSYLLVTSNDLAKSFTAPPTRVRMLQATIFTAPGEENEGFDFGSHKDTAQFEAAVARRYVECGSLSETDGPAIVRSSHCPVSRVRIYFPYKDFKVYELGAGNGTLALNTLNYLRAHYPEVYDRTVYAIIEISAPLANAQRTRLRRAGHGQRTANVEHRSVFSWTKTEHAPCYVLAAEVVDNFAHDLVRYDIRTLEPFQGLVSIDGEGGFVPYYTRITDPLIASFLSLRQRIKRQPPLPWCLRTSPLRRVISTLPFAPNLSPPEYIPTRQLSLLRLLRAHFPRHRLLLTDFSSLPDAVPGENGRVVQTSVRGMMVPCETIFVRQGYFDILFPTAFEQLRDMYECVLEQPAGTSDGPFDSKRARLSPFASDTSPLSLDSHFFSLSSRRSPLDGVKSASGLPFMETYGDPNKTRLRNGENPMLAYYKNVKFLF